MNLLPNAEQEQLADTVRAVLEKRFPVRRLLGDGRGRPSPEEWRELAELGWFGLGLGVDAGGAGGSSAEEMLAFVEFGTSLLSGPVLGTVLGAHAAALAGDNDTANAIATGEAQVGLFVDSDSGGYVIDGTDAPVVLAISEYECQLIDVTDITVVDRIDCIDTAVDLQSVHLEPADAKLTVTGEVASRLYLRGAVLAAAFQVGSAQATLAQSLQYAKDRYQFGQPIGGFQAIKHRCADMAIQAEAAWSITALAALSIDDDLERAQLLAASAKAVADRVARSSAATNVQNHGGIGYTWDYGAHLFVSRAEVFGELLQPTQRALRNVYASPVS
jgi:alkylation response protein AidB-like acyl-CoA dehydrogenase